MTLTTPLVLLILLLLGPLILYVGWPRNRFRRMRDSISLGLRLTIVVLVVLALAGVQIVQSADRLAVVFLVDVSDSMSTSAQEAALDYIREALPEMQVDDLAGVVVFGADAQVARSMSSVRGLDPLRTIPVTSNTNLAAAIRLGLALFPNDTARRMVILGDGIPTLGDTEAAAQLAASAGVEISYVPFTRPEEPEIQVRDVITPSVLDENQLFDLTVTIASEEDTRATVTIFVSGQIVNRQEVDLRAGTNNYTLRMNSGTSGFRDFHVQVDPIGDDGFYQNNRLAAFSRVEGVPRVLVVSGDRTGVDESRYIVTALQESGLDVDVVSPDGLPISATGLVAYESVMLVNTSALTLSTNRMEMLKTYVSELGGGLVVVGGPDAYGPGGYVQTPLEEALPVEMQLKDEERIPQLTIAYVIDRSGSMGMMATGGVSNLDLAKEAIIRSVDLLHPTDRAGVVSFDVNSYWVAEIQDVFDRTAIQRQVATLRPGGGTSIMAGMRLVSESLIREDSPLKHIILLTDGGADPNNLVELSGNLNSDYEITTSVISIGAVESQFLKDMAEQGGGNYHQVLDPSTIPTIFTLETVLATRSYIQEMEFVPTLTAVHPIVQGIDALPALEGYVGVTERAASQVILRGPEPYTDPILAAWQYGLGRSVAFASDATARWGANWVTWDRFAEFWSQAVRWTITEGTSQNLETRVVMDDEQARIIVDARDVDGAFINGLRLQASVVNSDDVVKVMLRQVAPGRYEGTFIPEGEGAYLLRVTHFTPDGQPDLTLSQTSGWVMSYSPEYSIRENSESVLERVAAITNGRDVTETPGAVFDHNIEARNTLVPISPWLLLVAMLLLPFDIAVRRLLLTQSDLVRLRQWMFRRRSAVADTAGARISVLREARDRARTRAEEQSVTQAARRGATVGALRQRTVATREQLSQQQTSAEADKETVAPKPRYTPPDPKPQDKKSGDDDGNIGARLLKRRRDD